MEPETPTSPVFVSASTAPFRGDDKFEFWRVLSRQGGIEVECEAKGHDPFEASGAGVILGDMSIFRIQTSASRFRRIPERVNSDSLDALAIYFVREGHVFVEQEGRSVLLSAGNGVVCDANRPFVIECDAPQTTLAVRLPRALLPPRAHLAHFTGRPLGLAGSAGAMLTGFAQSLANQAPCMDRATLNRMMDIFTELLDTTFDAMAGASVTPRSHGALVRERVKAYIREHLRDPRLRPAALPEHLHLSLRYLQKLFADEHTSPGRFLWEERLRHAARLLRHSADDVSITTIAIDSGFTNVSHFSRTFRDAFGLSPSDYRAQRRRE